MADERLFQSETELDALFEAFEAARIPNEAWQHRDHLAIAALYLLQRKGLDDIRAGIQKLNAANGVEVTPTGGYHETITRAWTHLVAHRLEAEKGDRLMKVNAVIAELGDKKLLLRYYSRDRIMSQEARYGWLEPDLENLP